MSKDPSKNMLDLLKSLTSAGIGVPYADREVLRHTDRIEVVAAKNPAHPALDGRQHLWLTEEQAAQVRVREINPQPKAESYFARIPQAWKDEWKDKKITKNDWCGFEPDQYTKDKEFRKFINSSHERFDRIKPHKKFWLYCEQALRWIAEKKFVHDVERRHQREFVLEEFRRGRENPMYWAIKYGYIRDDSYPGGWRKYDASTPQALIFWLADCNLSAELGKGRQGAITSTRMLRRAIMMLTRHSHEAVMMTDDVETTGNAIMSQKLLSSIQYMIRRNPWMKPSDQPNWKPKGITLTWGSSSKKAEKKTYSSTTTLISSAQGQAANGANVSEADVDEAQNVKTYGSLKREMRPQMLANIDGILRVRRSLWAWGCVCAGTKVWDNDGTLKNIEDLQPHEGILGFDQKAGTVSQEPITYWAPPADKPCYRIETNFGRHLECSHDHPVLWSHTRSRRRTGPGKTQKKAEFKEASDIKVGDQIIVAESVPFFGVSEMWEPRLVGWLIGDGYYGRFSVRLSTADKEIQSYVESRFDCATETGHTTKDGKEYKEIRINAIQPHLRALGIFGQSKQSKRLPDVHRSLCKKDAAELIGGLFDADGSVIRQTKPSAHHVVLTSCVRELLEEAQLLLQKFAVHGRLSYVKARPGPNRKGENGWYTLTISGKKNILSFRDNIKFSIAYKQERLEFIANAMKGRPSKHADGMDGLRTERVTAVKYIGIKPIYNLTAGATNTYLANGIVTHNTGNKDHAGGGAFQAEITTTMGRWERGEDTSSFVPLFFDWTCRPGVTEEDYIREYNSYISGEADGMTGLSKEEQMAAFLSAWPSKFADMWLASHTTIIPQVQISEALDLILAHYHSKGLPIKGLMEPIYNTSLPTPEGSYIPFAIQDVRFEVLDPDYPDPPIKAVAMPERGWLHRYYHGTDPIQSAGGTSAFGSVIWDNVGFIKEDGEQTRYYPYVSAILNWRPLRIEEAYLQSMMLGMYYRNDGQKACKEVVEANAGQDYIRFKTSAPFNLAESLWWRTALPPAYQGGQHLYGVDMKNNSTNSRKTSLFRDIQRFHSDFRAGTDGNRGLPPVPFYEYYTQLRDMGVEETKRGAIEFGVMNHKIQRDDLVFAVQYAYMSCITANKRPEKIGTQPKKQTVRKLRMDPVTLEHYYVSVTEDVRLPVHQ